jgi:hypothetical protein
MEALKIIEPVGHMKRNVPRNLLGQVKLVAGNLTDSFSNSLCVNPAHGDGPQLI